MSGWISVDVKLPKENELVIVGEKGIDNSHPFVAFYYHKEKKWGLLNMTFHPTHWMPLPEPPK